MVSPLRRRLADTPREAVPYRWFDETTGKWVDDPPSPAHLADLPARWLEEMAAGADDLGAEVTTSPWRSPPACRPTRWPSAQQGIAEAQGQNRHDDTCDNVLALLR